MPEYVSCIPEGFGSAAPSGQHAEHSVTLSFVQPPKKRTTGFGKVFENLSGQVAAREREREKERERERDTYAHIYTYTYTNKNTDTYTYTHTHTTQVTAETAYVDPSDGNIYITHSIENTFYRSQPRSDGNIITHSIENTFYRSQPRLPT
jgi:hypothetical protein